MAAVQRRQPLPSASHQPRRGDPACSGAAPPPVCRYWKSGHCGRNPCRFLHADPAPPPPPVVVARKRSNTWVNTSSKIAKPSATVNDAEAAVPPVPPPTAKPSPATNAREATVPPAPSERVQEPPGGGAWWVGDGIRGVARLEGHAKAVTGVAVPEGSGKLFSGSLDGTVRAWDCATGECVRVALVQEGEVGRMIAMGPWVLVGVRGAVRALHAGSGDELRLQLPSPAEQVTALLAEDDERLFGRRGGRRHLHVEAGPRTPALRRGRRARGPRRARRLVARPGKGRALLRRGGRRHQGLGPRDAPVRLQLRRPRVRGHHAAVLGPVPALLVRRRHRQGLEVQAGPRRRRTRAGGALHPQGRGRASGRHGRAHDADKKPVLLVSRGDGVVRVYDLPSFKPRGQIRCNGEVTAMSLRTPGVVFTGDASGEVRVVKWTPAAAA